MEQDYHWVNLIPYGLGLGDWTNIWTIDDGLSLSGHQIQVFTRAIYLFAHE